ncbi:hypothetical protein C5D18_15105 [Rathayibacter tritici]|nr:hypothetical protein C5D18_15105 [Rathayibacter tritici]
MRRECDRDSVGGVREAEVDRNVSEAGTAVRSPAAVAGPGDRVGGGPFAVLARDELPQACDGGHGLPRPTFGHPGRVLKVLGA